MAARKLINKTISLSLLPVLIFLSTSISYSSQDALRVPIQSRTAGRFLATAERLTNFTYYNPIPASFGHPLVVDFSKISKRHQDELLRLKKDTILLINSRIPFSFLSRLKTEKHNIKGLVVLKENLNAMDIDPIIALNIPVIIIGLESAKELKFKNTDTLILAPDGIKVIDASAEELKEAMEIIAQTLTGFEITIFFDEQGGVGVKSSGSGVNAYDLFSRTSKGVPATTIYGKAVRSIGRRVTIPCHNASKEQIVRLLREGLGFASVDQGLTGNETAVALPESEFNYACRQIAEAI